VGGLKKTIAITLFILFCTGLTIFSLMHTEKPVQTKDEQAGEQKVEKKRYENLDEAVKDSKRINILALGVEEEPRSDTIVLISLDSESDQIDMLFIPRDTYYHEEGRDRGDQRKLNAAYGRGGGEEAKKAVEDILYPVPIHHYVVLKYEGVEEMVNLLGGVEVDVPEGIEDLQPGRQVLNGKQAVNFLRFRAGYPEGDLGRIKAQQQFIRSAIQKVSIPKLPFLAKKIFPYLETDISKEKMVSYAVSAAKVRKEDIFMHVLPGTAQYRTIDAQAWSYFFHDVQETTKLLEILYHVETN